MEDHLGHAASELDLGLAFLAGVLGSGHCVGMCGALVSGFFMRAKQSSRSYLPYFSYHLARVSVYTLIGVLAASLGFVLLSTGLTGKFQAVLQIVIGLFVIVLAFGILGFIPWQGSFRFLPVSVLSRGFGAAARYGPVTSAAAGGILNGLMPCPLTFAMAVRATTAGSPAEGGLMMLAFGLGTFPTMVLVSIAFGNISVKVRGVMLKSAAVIMILMGMNTFYKGVSFFTEESFRHRTFFHFLSESVYRIAMYLMELVQYISELAGNLQF